MTAIHIELTPHTEAVIRQVTQSMGVSIDQFFISSAYEKAITLMPTIHQQFHQELSQPINSQSPNTTTDMLLTDFVKTLPKASFDDDVVNIQRAMRDEWD